MQKDKNTVKEKTPIDVVSFIEVDFTGCMTLYIIILIQ